MEVQGGEDEAGAGAGAGRKKQSKDKKSAGCSHVIAGISSKCKASYCRNHYCDNIACQQMLSIHEPMCQKAAEKNKEAKAAAKSASEPK
jgi:hypothetical protein